MCWPFPKVVKWRSSYGMELHMVKCILDMYFILPRIIIGPHTNITHVEFQHLCVGDPVESMCGHSMEPTPQEEMETWNSTHGVYYSMDLLHFLSIPYGSQ